MNREKTPLPRRGKLVLPYRYFINDARRESRNRVFV
jgi:hypothetical protein